MSTSFFTRLFAGAWIALTLLLASMQPAQAATRHPILFVHGWSADSSTWTTMVGRFQQDGWSTNELYNWSYDSDLSNTQIAAQIKSRVDMILATTGASKVDIITHSMGGLSSRYYLKNLGGTAQVDAWVSLGGPNHGTSISYGCFSVSCAEMRPGSSFLNALNATDETPGAVRYGTWWSTCDGVIYPANSVVLSGATNTKTGCITHSNLHENATVYSQVRNWINQ